MLVSEYTIRNWPIKSNYIGKNIKVEKKEGELGHEEYTPPYEQRVFCPA